VDFLFADVEALRLLVDEDRFAFFIFQIQILTDLK
jgi:hypothetical protein